jgi:hypothetical protein
MAIASGGASKLTVVQIQLVVGLSVPPATGGEHLCGDAALPPLLVDLVGNVGRGLALLVVVVEDGAAVLGAHIGALAVLGGGVMHAVEELEQCAVRDLFRVVDDLQGLGVWRTELAGASDALGAWELLTACPPTADGAVPRVLNVAANVPDARIQQPLLGKLAPEHVLDAPEAASGDRGRLRAGGNVDGLGGGGAHAEGAQEAGQKGHRGVEEEEESDTGE